MRRDEMASLNRLGENTYGHAEDRLLGLVNFTLGHCEGCAEDRCNNKKKERRLGSVKKNTRDGEEKKREKGREGAEGGENKILPWYSVRGNERTRAQSGRAVDGIYRK